MTTPAVGADSYSISSVSSLGELDFHSPSSVVSRSTSFQEDRPHHGSPSAPVLAVPAAFIGGQGVTTSHVEKVNPSLEVVSTFDYGKTPLQVKRRRLWVLAALITVIVLMVVGGTVGGILGSRKGDSKQETKVVETPKVYEDLDGQRASTSVMEPNLETPPVTWILPVESPPASASSSAPRIKDNRL